MSTSVITLVATFWVLFGKGDLTAPPITGSLSFNEKIFYIANNKITEHRDVIAVGSSMTLNNLASEVMVRDYTNSYFNYASWGLTIKQADYYIRFLEAKYHPKVVLMVSSLMDFYRSGRAVKFFDYDEINAYIAHPAYLKLYYDHFDPIYLVRNSLNIKRYRTTNDGYKSLMFDSYGGVGLNISKSNIKKERWERRILIEKMDDEAYAALLSLASYLKNKGVKFVFVQPPIRAFAVQGAQNGLDEHWRKIRRIATETGMKFINLYGIPNFGDRYYVDYSHFNQEGADRFTRQVVGHMKSKWLH